MSKFNRLVDQLLKLEPSLMSEKHYAMVFKGKKIVAMNVNQYGSKIMGYHVPAIHAEMAVIAASLARGKQYYGLRPFSHPNLK